ncbi:MAG: S41 family peptidase [Ignavibacteria bacterium]
MKNKISKHFRIKSNRLYLILLLLTFSLSSLSVSSLHSSDDIYDRINKNMTLFGQIYKEITLNYVDQIDVDKFFRAGIEGMLGTLDPYTVYYDSKSKGIVDLITAGRYGGIGISIKLKDSLIRIMDVMHGYEAERKGLRIGDIIREVDGVNVTNMEVDRIRYLIRGTPGTTVNLRIQREKDLIDFSLTRETIQLKNISYSDFVGDKQDGIAYIRLDRFTNTTTNEVDNILRNFKATNNLKSLIIDLRNNGGGVLEAAIGTLEKLVAKNSLLLITRGNSKDSERKYFSKEEPIISSSIPIVILVNENTASASEIVAGAIQDLDRGVIIGTKTFGKGLVQQIKDLDNEAKLKITTARYFTPSGRWIQEKDYFKDNKAGVFLNTEQFLKQEYKTLNGRSVIAKGGIVPDIEVKVKAESELHSALLMRDMFFKFANYYLTKHPDVSVFNCTEDVYQEFLSFIFQQGFEYKSSIDRKLEEIRNLATEKGYTESFLNTLTSLTNQSLIEKQAEFVAAKAEISRSIEEEINKRIITEKEQIEATFGNDIQLQQAISILKNLDYYYSLLQLK